MCMIDNSNEGQCDSIKNTITEKWRNICVLIISKRNNDKMARLIINRL